MERDKRFKTDILNELGQHADVDAMLDIAQNYKEAGGSQRTAYEILQEIWLDFGFDDDDGEEDRLRDNLEYVMERVWGFCPQGLAVWGKSLSDQDFN